MKPKPDEDEIALFREAIRGVKPLAHAARVTHEPAKPRGQYRVQAELDLHGLTAAEASVRLREFLITALQRNARCLRIVRRTAQVLAFASARQVDGGTGAVYVLLDPAHASSASTARD